MVVVISIGWLLFALGMILSNSDANETEPKITMSFQQFENFKHKKKEIIHKVMGSKIQITMKTRDYLNQLLESILFTVLNDVPGDIAEFGTWMGGTSIAAAQVLHYLVPATQRKYHLFDSFEGHPDYTKTKDKDFDLVQYSKTFPADIDFVQGKFREYGLGDKIESGSIVFHKGFHESTLPGFNRTLALIFADSDAYTSTTTILHHTWDLLSTGGFVIIDDYYAYESCRNAIRDFMALKKIPESNLAMPYGNVEGAAVLSKT